MALNAYIQATQRLIHDPTNQFWPTADITAYINEGRTKIAAKGQCVRVLPPTSGGIGTVTVVTAGTGYVGVPTVTAVGLGTGFTATAVMSGTTVASVTVNTPGTGYFPQSTSIVFTPTSGGSGATATANIANVNQTVINQEVYPFSAVNPLVQLTSGVGSILAVLSVSISWGQGMKPTLFSWDWGSFQAQLRSYSFGLTGYPSTAAQFGQGVGGSIYLWPIPSGVYAMDWDCICLPLDLVSDSTPEAIPVPWTAAIPYYAAMMCFKNSRQKDSAADMKKDFDEKMTEARSFSDPGMIPSYYDDN